MKLHKAQEKALVASCTQGEATTGKDGFQRKQCQSELSRRGLHRLTHCASRHQGKSEPRALVPTIVVCKELDLFQGIKLLFRTVGHAQDGGTEPHILDFQVAGIHKENVSRKQIKHYLRAFPLIGFNYRP